MSARQPISAFRRNDDGGAAVEFAIVSPFLLVLIAGIFYVGWAMHSISSARYVLEEGARALQLNPTMTEEQFSTLVNTRLTEMANAAAIVTLDHVVSAYGTKEAHATATVPISLSIPFFTPFTFEYSASVTVPLKS